ncbi:MAG TPA: hypothetical protein VF816_07375 [Rhodocyclaceae bacterium]
MADGNDDLLHKADALMRRHRVFVAGANDAAFADAAAPADGADDDVPVLTEIVAAEAVPAAGRTRAVDVAALRAALAAELETWLDAELPTHVQRVLDGVTDQLILQLSDKARTELLPRLQSLLAEPDTSPTPAPQGD